MSRQGRLRVISPAVEPRSRPLYARVLRLRQLNPSGVLCFVFFEGAVVVGLLLALAELVSWWAMLVLPVLVAVMVKANDVVAGSVVRRAALVPEQEQERFRREIAPALAGDGLSTTGFSAPAVETRVAPRRARRSGRHHYA